MKGLSDTDRKAYEAYILAKDEQEREEAIKKLIPGSELYYYLYFVDKMKKVGSKLDDQDQQLLVQFQQRYWNSRCYKKISARLEMYQYEQTASEEQRARILKGLATKADYNMYLNYDHVKPEDMRRQDDSHSSQSEDEGTSPKATNTVNSDLIGLDFGGAPQYNFGAISQGPKSKPHELKYEKYFSKEEIRSLYTPTGNEHTDFQRIQVMPQSYDHKINFADYHMNAVHNFAIQYKNLRVADIQNESFFQKIALFLHTQYTPNTYYNINGNLSNNLTLQQMDKLSSLVPQLKNDKNFIGAYFQKLFYEELSQENQEVWTHEEKRSNLITLYNYAKSNKLPTSLQQSLLIEILNLGIKLNQYDEQLFRDYIKMPLYAPHGVFKQQKQQYGDRHWSSYINNVQSQKNVQGQWHETQNELVNAYLEHFCQESAGSLESFKDEFDVEFLKVIEEKIAIFNADDLTNLKVDIKKYQEFSSEVQLKFLESNPDLFKVDDEVQLQLLIKNVQTLYIKIFEFNTETYYKKTLQPFNTGVNLDGLIASIEKQFEYSHAPNKKFIETFNFPELNGKIGLFIVEFIGNGLSSRAVIKKGSLSMIHRPTIAGHLCYVLDENKKICSGPKTGIYFDSQYYEADQEKGGKIFIPYGSSNLVSKAILMNNGFAQLCDFERQTEVYSFTCTALLNQESILIGNKAQIIIKPNLLINQRPASLTILKNTKVNITTYNYIDNIPVTKKFEDLTFNDSKELILDFQVPPYLAQITFKLESEVYNVTQRTHTPFIFQKDFKMASNHSTKKMSDIYLRKEKGDYYLYLLGKNGEPKKNVNVTIGIIHAKKGINNKARVDITTDKNGKIKLGHLRKVIGIDVSVQLFSIHQNFMLQLHRQNLSYPPSADINENDVYELPVLFNEKKRTKIQLIKYQSHIVLEDMYDRIEFNQQEGKDYNKIQIKGLSDGTYQLFLKDQNHKIVLIVHKGQFWEGDSFILKRNCLFENKTNAKMVKIEKVLIEESKDEIKKEVVIKLEDSTKYTRVHIQANLFEQNMNPLNFLNIYKDIVAQSFSKTVFPFAMWKNIFMNNRELSDEFRYVFDRKYAERFQGNTLERPKLVLKRTLVGATQIDQEQLRSGTQFAQQQMTQEIQSFSQNVAPMAYQSQPIAPQSYTTTSNRMQLKTQNFASGSFSKNNADFGYGGNANLMDEFSLLKMCEMVSGQNIPLPDMQNFLKQGPLQIFNLTPNEQGEIRFSANLNAYTQLQILVVDRQSVASKNVDLEIKNIQKRDLSLVKPLDVEKGFTESRLTQCILSGESHFIEDITSTEMQLIDDMKKVRGVLDELMRMKGTSNQANSVYQELIDSVIMKWTLPATTQDEKNKLFSKHQCHELNIFIYMKDQDFFQTTVKPFLAHKMEKTFIDNYLLGNYQECLHFFDIGRIHKLNPLEQCFLAEVLCQEQRQEDAKRILGNMSSRRDYLEGNDRNQQNRIFDTVLNLNMQKAQNADLNGQPINLFGGQDPFADASLNNFSFGAPAFNQTPPMGGAGGFGQAMPSGGGLFGGTTISPTYNPAPTYISAAQPMMGQPQMMMQQQQQIQQQQALFSNFAAPQQMMGGAGYGAARNAPQQNMMLNRVQPAAYQQDYYYSSNNMDLFGGDDIMQRYNETKSNTRLKFEELQQTNEYVDTNYFKQINQTQQATRFMINQFFVDYCEYICSGDQAQGKPFLTSSFIKNADNSASALITFALLDLKFESDSHIFVTNEGRGLSIQAANNLILFKKEVREAKLEVTNDILVIHRYDKADSQQSSASMPDEFLTNTAYQCEVIMTNVSPQQKEFSILYQIPQGALPIELTKYMKSIPQSLSPYTTQKLLFYFYFPQEGTFTHFPSNVSENDEIIARAQTNELKVVNRLSINKKETFRDIVQSGNKEDILEFLRTENLYKYDRGFNLTDLMWMLKEREFYLKVVQVLRFRFIYFEEVWKFSLYHSDEDSAIEFLTQNQTHNLKKLLGKVFHSRLISYNEFDKEIKHFDYYPMINSRAHQVGDVQNWTLNRNVRKTYDRFLKRLTESKEFNLADRMQMVYYLQLQDRIQEAINVLATIKIEDSSDATLKLQYDYFQAYFDFFTGQSESFKTARALVRKYEDYPIASWRMAFLEILDQLNEFDGEIEDIQEIDDENMSDEQKKQKMKQSIAKEPRLDVDVSGEKQKISLEVANIKQIAIKFYIIDAEILFSRTPFLKENTEEFSYVKPCHVIERDLSNVDLNTSIDSATYLQQPQKIDLEIPENLKNQNMVIEFNGEGMQIFKTYYSTQIKVVIQEAYGELKVTDVHGLPLPKVYVKVFYQKKDDSTSAGNFFRDGYTDIRGKFEYAQTSGSKLSQVKKFAVLVLSDNLGSIIRECNPPKFDAPASKESDIYGAESQQQMMKQERILKNVGWHKQNYSKAK
eukprot:403337784